ncbi:hypothetical protein AB1046_00440 [Promicromonospora sp. Populi]|uniref:hypothetical protein n=1 Tax=Promicromonospora sp. Populi TaxID=3239420 RepID=UPI0034E2FABF
MVTGAAPDLAPKLYYGQPGYARKGKVVCFFRSGQMDKERYSTFGFSAEANLDDASGLWPTSYALTGLDDKDGEGAGSAGRPGRSLARAQGLRGSAARATGA